MGRRGCFGSVLFTIAFLALILFPCLKSSAAEKATYKIDSFAKYVEIPGATPVGSDACTSCHTEVRASFRHALHAQQGVECEDCHGNGSLHVAGQGDVTKILNFSDRPVSAANGVCLSCHTRDEKVRYWSGGAHSANRVRCVDCHESHEPGPGTARENPLSLDIATRGAFAEQSVVPETATHLRPLSQTNDACIKCHPTEGAQLSLPYHHPLREGKMSCVDCHDPHGGPAGNNLRTANLNQLCLTCHAQYRGPFAYQHPPVTESCLNCHTAHGSPNTNLLSVSEPALCLQCHAGHHNGAGLPLVERCTNCHGSIHGTDVATPSGGSRFIDKGPFGVPSEPPQPSSAGSAAMLAHPVSPLSASARLRPIPSHVPNYAIGAAGAALGMFSEFLPAGSNETSDPAGAEAATPYWAYSLTPGAHRFVDGSGFLGRVGEYDSLQESEGANAQTAFVSPEHHLTIVSRATMLTGQDYFAGLQLNAGDRLQFGFDTRGFVQQQDKYPFYAGVMSPDLLPITDLIPANTPFGVKRRLGSAHARYKVPKLPVRLFLKGSWQARVGLTQLAYLNENSDPTNACSSCHFTSQYQPVNYTTRNIGGGADVDLGAVRLTWEHSFSSFNDRLSFPIGAYTAGFFPEVEPTPAPSGPAPADFPAGNYYLDIPAPSHASWDSLNLNWTASPELSFNGHVSYTRTRDMFTRNPQNGFDTDNTLNWRPVDRLRVTAGYHQQNLINNFSPYYSLFGDMSYHDHAEDLRLDYELPKDFDVEAHYRRRDITRSNAFLWPQIYSIDNTDLLPVVPSSSSNTAGLALRYHHGGLWSARAGYEWIGTHDPGYLIVPKSNNRAFADLTFTPAHWLVFANDTSVIVQNAFPAIALPNLSGDFQRRNRFYTETASATLRLVPDWNLGLGYSYQQNNLTTYLAFQNDSAAGYVVDQPAVPYKQIGQAYWGESTYTVKQRLGLNLRLTYNSARSAFRPDLNPNNPAAFGNGALMSQNAFDPVLFQQALDNLELGSTQVSQVIVPEWIGQSKAFYLLPRRFEAGLIFDYGSYRDFWNPNLNGVLRIFNVYFGRSW